jgi:uncharacterized protein YkwD
MPVARHHALAVFAVATLALGLAACSMGGGGAPLSAGLAARMDAPGASLNRGEALGIVNHFRAASGTGMLNDDPALDATAQALATQYAATGTPPRKPDGASGFRVSAGYPTFAETFSGWRNSPADAAALTDKTATRAGVASAYNPGSAYGVYWVLVLAN